MAILLQSVSKLFPARGRRGAPLYRSLKLLGGSRTADTQFPAIDAVDLEIPDGARVAVVGRNGAGKTTLLRLVAGIYQPSSGRLRADGPICCFLQTGAGAAPSLSARDNVMLYGALAGLSHRESVAGMGRVLEFASLTDQAWTIVEQLSFGYQQRLFISVMLEAMRLGKARIYMFDEFLVGVDKAFREQVVAALSETCGPDQILIHASHDDELVRGTCTLAIHVDAGRIRQFGPVAEVLERYRSE